MARHCAGCGAPLPAPDAHGVERCGHCGRVAYRNSKPCVGALIVRDGRVLLSRRAREPHAGLWDLPGGFLDAAEHPEAGVVREVREETGLEARVLRLAGIAMGKYAFQGEEHDTLNLVYQLEVAEGEPRASDDSAEMRWFSLAELPSMAFAHEERLLRELTEAALST